ncbi:wall-associated receptor kinase-like 8 [Vitis riparia]|uniref:wall-associated receptor kinase-like 8 n=1 Tax=Vitis riparia TaxID=96939 RepID=UPI00155AA3E7|nr:wall-associated receptor kinase-like 8 [Vitis riparia]
MRGQWVIQLTIICLLWLADESSATAPSMAKPGCEQDHCGDMLIPYPFGMGKSCYKDEWFSIYCIHSSDPPKPILSKLNLEVLSIEMGGFQKSVMVNSPIYSNCENGEVTSSSWQSIDLRGSPFLYSLHNDLVGVGCHNVLLRGGNEEIMAGCSSTCDNHGRNEEFITTKGCLYGINCCLTRLQEDLDVYSLNTTASYSERGDCTYAFLAYNYNNVSNVPTIVRDAEFAPLLISWLIPEQVDPQNCVDDTVYTSRGNYSNYRCDCNWAEEGNPYLAHGCQVVRECANCRWGCDGHYNSSTDKYDFHCRKSKALILGCSISGGLLLLLIFSFGLYKVVRKQLDIRVKKRFFKRNGGLLLQQQISSDKVAFEKTKIFTSEELEKATDNFNKNRILGQGGQGTVYKGMLNDGRIVAVKRSKIVDENQLEHFINEIVILSQINHRNVVGILGCCLETEVPLLVYEFISNGTLFQLIHDQNSEFPLSWEMRLRIASEVSGALSYLHSACSIPIYHRDIKSTNILLDDKYKAKVSDFGTSRSISIDQTHLTTIVQGTLGYLDPEYFQSSQFTEKSDVYSFGVVLVELLTGQKPISSTRSQEEKSLAIHFILSLQESRLFDILDARVVKEGRKKDIMTFAKLAGRCLNLNGRKRPTMKEVTTELDNIRVSALHLNVDQNFQENACVVTEITKFLDMDDTSTSRGSCLDDTKESSFDVQPLLFHTL